MKVQNYFLIVRSSLQLSVSVLWVDYSAKGLSILLLWWERFSLYGSHYKGWVLSQLEMLSFTWFIFFTWLIWRRWSLEAHGLFIFKRGKSEGCGILVHRFLGSCTRLAAEDCFSEESRECNGKILRLWCQ